MNSKAGNVSVVRQILADPSNSFKFDVSEDKPLWEELIYVDEYDWPLRRALFNCRPEITKLLWEDDRIVQACLDNYGLYAFTIIDDLMDLMDSASSTEENDKQSEIVHMLVNNRLANPEPYLNFAFRYVVLLWDW